MEIGQILLYIMALGLPTAWVTGWLYRVWRKANMPAILGVLNRQRRRDNTIKETRLRVDAFEVQHEESEQTRIAFEAQLREMEAKFQNVEGRVNTTEKMIAQLRQKLRSRGVLSDA